MVNAAELRRVAAFSDLPDVQIQWFLTRIIHDFRSTKGLAMVQIRCLRGFETKSEAFA